MDIKKNVNMFEAFSYLHCFVEVMFTNLEIFLCTNKLMFQRNRCKRVQVILDSSNWKLTGLLSCEKYVSLCSRNALVERKQTTISSETE